MTLAEVISRPTQARSMFQAAAQLLILFGNLPDRASLWLTQSITYNEGHVTGINLNFRASNFEKIVGTSVDDQITTGSGNDTLDGEVVPTF